MAYPELLLRDVELEGQWASDDGLWRGGRRVPRPGHRLERERHSPPPMLVNQGSRRAPHPQTIGGRPALRHKSALTGARPEPLLAGAGHRDADPCYPLGVHPVYHVRGHAPEGEAGLARRQHRTIKRGGVVIFWDGPARRSHEPRARGGGENEEPQPRRAEG